MKKLQIQELTITELKETNGGDKFMRDLGYAFAWTMDHTFGAIDRYFMQFR